MTQTSPDILRVQLHSWNVIRDIALEGGNTPEAFIEEGLMVTLDAAKTVLANRAAGKEQTYVIVGSDESGFHIADDLEAVLKERTVEPEVPDLGVADPFESDEGVDLSIDPQLLGDVHEVSSVLNVDPLVLVQVAVDVRYMLQTAAENNQLVLLATADKDTYTKLPTRFTA